MILPPDSNSPHRAPIESKEEQLAVKFHDCEFTHREHGKTALQNDDETVTDG